ncbi:MAG: hypothetical protein ACKVTZ_01495 [Bacteroidia bacterium]
MMELKKRRDIGDVIQDTINFALQEAKPLWRMVFAYITPAYMAFGIVSGFFQYRIKELGFQEKLVKLLEEKDVENLQKLSNEFVIQIYGSWQFIAIILISFILSSFSAACVYLYMKRYAEGKKESLSDREMYQEASSELLRLIGYNIIGSILAMLGFSLFIIPGLYLLVPISLLLVVAIAENRNLGESLSRSFSLTKGNWWMAAVSIILLALIGSFGTGIPQSLFSLLILSLKSFIGEKMVIVISSVISSGLSSLYHVFICMAIGILYYSFYKEKMGWEEQISEIGNEDE